MGKSHHFSVLLYKYKKKIKVDHCTENHNPPGDLFHNPVPLSTEEADGDKKKKKKKKGEKEEKEKEKKKGPSKAAVKAMQEALAKMKEEEERAKQEEDERLRREEELEVQRQEQVRYISPSFLRLSQIIRAPLYHQMFHRNAWRPRGRRRRNRRIRNEKRG